MSTVPEVIAANHMGMSVVGLSCITNKAAGLSDTAQKLSHDEVMETGNLAKEKLSGLLSGYLAKLPQALTN
jgi:purine-nucleoside phosphorylase